MSRYQKVKTNLDLTEARGSEWQWQQLGHMQVCISPQTDNHASTPPLMFLQAGCPSCRPTNSVKPLKALEHITRTATGNTDLPTLFKRYHSDKHFSGFLPTRWRQQSTGTDMEQNYVTVSHPMYINVVNTGCERRPCAAFAWPIRRS